MTAFVERILRAASFDVDTYQEVEADIGATSQALSVAVLASIASGIGLGVSYAESGPVAILVGFVFGTILALIGWFIWVFVTFVVGTKMLPEPETQASFADLLRTTGFAQAPGILRIVTIIPILGFLIGLVVWMWMLAAFAIAVRQALQYESTGRAIVVSMPGFVVNIVLNSFTALTVGLLITLITTQGEPSPRTIPDATLPANGGISMDPTVAAALITAAAIIVAALIGGYFGTIRGRTQGYVGIRRLLDEREKLLNKAIDLLERGHDENLLGVSMAIVENSNTAKEIYQRFGDLLDGLVEELQSALRQEDIQRIRRALSALHAASPGKRAAFEAEVRKYSPTA